MKRVHSSPAAQESHPVPAIAIPLCALVWVADCFGAWRDALKSIPLGLTPSGILLLLPEQAVHGVVVACCCVGFGEPCDADISGWLPVDAASFDLRGLLERQGAAVRKRVADSIRRKVAVGKGDNDAEELYGCSESDSSDSSDDASDGASDSG